MDHRRNHNVPPTRRGLLIRLASQLPPGSEERRNLLAILRQAFSISKTFDRYERMNVWTVYDTPPSSKAAQFPASVYGERRAKQLAEDFYQKLQNGTPWNTAYNRIPKTAGRMTTTLEGHIGQGLLILRMKLGQGFIMVPQIARYEQQGETTIKHIQRAIASDFPEVQISHAEPYIMVHQGSDKLQVVYELTIRGFKPFATGGTGREEYLAMILEDTQGLDVVDLDW